MSTLETNVLTVDCPFWSRPLAAWFRDSVASGRGWVDECQWRSAARVATPFLYADICDGIALNLLFLFIDRRTSNQKTRQCDASDVSGRLRNLATLLRNLQSFYKSVLGRLIVMPLPDLLSIARHPTPDGSGDEMHKVLLLLLGCAVQSDRKQTFIDRIKDMEVQLQTAIVQEIQKVTDEGECVLNVQALELDPDDQLTTSVLRQLQRVADERDRYAQSVFELTQEVESDSGSAASLCNGDICARKLPEALQHDGRTTFTGAADRHATVELASVKAELRKVRNDAEEKAELLTETREELAGREAELATMRQERIELLRDARKAKDCQDELDCLTHKVVFCEYWRK